MAKKGLRRDPLEGVPYGVNALIRNEGSSIELVAIEEIDLEDETFRTRPARDLSLLQESIELQGQMTPIILRHDDASGYWQVISGFRRVESLKALGQGGVQARIFDAMDSVAAVRYSVMENLFGGDLNGDALDAYAARLGERDLLTGATSQIIDWAREKVSRLPQSAQAPAGAQLPEEGSDLIDLSGLGGGPNLPLPDQIRHTFTHLSEAAQGLERIFLNWSDVTPSDRRVLAAECKYIHDIYPFLTR